MELKKITRGMLAAACLVAGAAQANSVTYGLTNIGSTATDLQDALMSFQQFQSSMGVLTGVKVEVFSDVSTSVLLTNNNSSSRTLDLTFPVILDLSMPFGPTLHGADNLLTTPITVDAKVDGVSGTASASDGLKLSASQTYTGAELAAFIGNGTLDSQLSVTADAALSMNKVRATFNTTASGYGQVTYFYDAPPVPEPETYGMLLAGLGVIALVAKRGKRAA